MKMNFSSLAYNPTHAIGVEKTGGDWGTVRFVLGHDLWKIEGMSYNRQNVTLGKVNRNEDRTYEGDYLLVKKIPNNIGINALRWRGSYTPIKSVRSMEEFIAFWTSMLKTIKPGQFGDIKIKGVGQLCNDPVLMIGDRENYVIGSQTGVHIDHTVRGTALKQKYVYQDNNGALLVPLSYIIKAIDENYDRFADPYDENPNKGINTNATRLLRLKWEETYTPKEG